MKKILVVDDEEGIRSFICEVLEDEGFSVDQACNGAEALKKISRVHYDLVISDMQMPKVSGIELLSKVKEEQPDTEMLILTAHGTVSSAVEAMKIGAFDYLSKPLDSPEELIILVERALEHQRLKKQVESYTANIGKSHSFISKSAASENVKKQLLQVAPTTATVLLTGESGTGKEVAARFIHSNSDRAKSPFIAVNCGAIPEHLLESELFGYEKGAFTGATERRKGRFELADEGTLFLDEISEMAKAMQVKLLRVLQEQTFERIGGTRTISTDVRIIAATNQNLSKAIKEGSFREDLYHRIAVFPVELVPLRMRPEDIEPISQHILKKLADKYKSKTYTLKDDALDKLIAYHWPGNVRELSNALERAAILCKNNTITAEDLLLKTAGEFVSNEDNKFNNQQKAGAVNKQVQENRNYDEENNTLDKCKETGTLKAIEKRAIEDALAATDGHRKKAAKMLGIALRTLYDKIKLYDIN